MKLKIKFTSSFKKDIKLLKLQGKDISLVYEIIEKLANGEKLPKENKNHSLVGRYMGFMECHIKPNWLLIYRIKEDELLLVLIRTGSHSNLLK